MRDGGHLKCKESSAAARSKGSHIELRIELSEARTRHTVLNPDHMPRVLTLHRHQPKDRDSSSTHRSAPSFFFARGSRSESCTLKASSRRATLQSSGRAPPSIPSGPPFDPRSSPSLTHVPDPVGTTAQRSAGISSWLARAVVGRRAPQDAAGKTKVKPL